MRGQSTDVIVNGIAYFEDSRFGCTDRDGHID